MITILFGGFSFVQYLFLEIANKIRLRVFDHTYIYILGEITNTYTDVV